MRTLHTCQTTNYNVQVGIIITDPFGCTNLTTSILFKLIASLSNYIEGDESHVRSNRFKI